MAGIGQLRAEAAQQVSAGILAALSPLRPGEGAMLQWVLAPDASGPASALRRFLTELRGEPRSPQPVRTDRTEPLLLACGRVAVYAADAGRRATLATQVLGSLHAAGSAEASLRRRLWPSVLAAGGLRAATAPFLAYPAALGADELAAVLGVPIKGPQLPGLTYAEARTLAPTSAVPRQGRVLGEAVAVPGRAVALDPAESAKGLYVLAPTGAGKSTLLTNLVCQDMAAGRAVVVIESKGDLITDLVDRVPANRLDDVIVFDPSDRAPVGFNLLSGGDSAELIVEHTVGQFRDLYKSALGPRSEHLLRAALTTLAADPEATLLDVSRVLTDESFRRRLAARLDDLELAGVWAWFEGLSVAQRSEVVSPLLNKLGAFTLRRRLRAVIGQARSPLDLGKVLAERKILLCSLAKGLIGDDAAALLGSALLSRLWKAIAARAALPAVERALAFVYLDEAQDYLRLPVALGDAIAQSRGYGVGWTVAHQHLAQLPAELRDALLANLRSKVVMQTTASDAAALAREFRPHLDAADLQGLGPFEAYAALSTGAAVAPPASIRTLPALEPTGSAAEVRRRSRERYGRDAAEVERSIRARIEGQAPEAPIGSRRRR